VAKKKKRKIKSDQGNVQIISYLRFVVLMVVDPRGIVERERSAHAE
jgi:hypothetical protein